MLGTFYTVAATGTKSPVIDIVTNGKNHRTFFLKADGTVWVCGLINYTCGLGIKGITRNWRPKRKPYGNQFCSYAEIPPYVHEILWDPEDPTVIEGPHSMLAHYDVFTTTNVNYKSFLNTETTIGNTLSINVPVQVRASPSQTLQDIVEIKSSNTHTLFRKSDGTVLICGKLRISVTTEQCSNPYAPNQEERLLAPEELPRQIIYLANTEYPNEDYALYPVNVLDEDGLILTNVIAMEATTGGSYFVKDDGSVWGVGIVTGLGTDDVTSAKYPQIELKDIKTGETKIMPPFPDGTADKDVDRNRYLDNYIGIGAGLELNAAQKNNITPNSQNLNQAIQVNSITPTVAQTYATNLLTKLKQSNGNFLDNIYKVQSTGNSVFFWKKLNAAGMQSTFEVLAGGFNTRQEFGDNMMLGTTNPDYSPNPTDKINLQYDGSLEAVISFDDAYVQKEENKAVISQMDYRTCPEKNSSAYKHTGKGLISNPTPTNYWPQKWVYRYCNYGQYFNNYDGKPFVILYNSKPLNFLYDNPRSVYFTSDTGVHLQASSTYKLTPNWATNSFYEATFSGKSIYKSLLPSIQASPGLFPLNFFEKPQQECGFYKPKQSLDLRFNFPSDVNISTTNFVLSESIYIDYLYLDKNRNYYVSPVQNYLPFLTFGADVSGQTRITFKPAKLQHLDNNSTKGKLLTSTNILKGCLFNTTFGSWQYGLNNANDIKNFTNYVGTTSEPPIENVITDGYQWQWANGKKYDFVTLPIIEDPSTVAGGYWNSLQEKIQRITSQDYRKYMGVWKNISGYLPRTTNFSVWNKDQSNLQLNYTCNNVQITAKEFQSDYNFDWMVEPNTGFNFTPVQPKEFQSEGFNKFATWTTVQNPCIFMYANFAGERATNEIIATYGNNQLWQTVWSGYYPSLGLGDASHLQDGGPNPYIQWSQYGSLTTSKSHLDKTPNGNAQSRPEFLIRGFITSPVPLTKKIEKVVSSATGWYLNWDSFFNDTRQYMEPQWIHPYVPDYSKLAIDTHSNFKCLPGYGSRTTYNRPHTTIFLENLGGDGLTSVKKYGVNIYGSNESGQAGNNFSQITQGGNTQGGEMKPLNPSGTETITGVVDVAITTRIPPWMNRIHNLLETNYFDYRAAFIDKVIQNPVLGRDTFTGNMSSVYVREHAIPTYDAKDLYHWYQVAQSKFSSNSNYVFNQTKTATTSAGFDEIATSLFATPKGGFLTPLMYNDKFVYTINSSTNRLEPLFTVTLNNQEYFMRATHNFTPFELVTTPNTIGPSLSSLSSVTFYRDLGEPILVDLNITVNEIPIVGPSPASPVMLNENLQVIKTIKAENSPEATWVHTDFTDEQGVPTGSGSDVLEGNESTGPFYYTGLLTNNTTLYTKVSSTEEGKAVLVNALTQFQGKLTYPTAIDSNIEYFEDSSMKLNINYFNGFNNTLSSNIQFYVAYLEENKILINEPLQFEPLCWDFDYDEIPDYYYNFRVLSGKIDYSSITVTKKPRTSKQIIREKYWLPMSYNLNMGGHCPYGASSYFVLDNGNVLSCGSNEQGQLGYGYKGGWGTGEGDNPYSPEMYDDNDTHYGRIPLIHSIPNYVKSPDGLEKLSGIKKVFAGYDNVFFLTSDGEVYACGANYFGEMGVGTDGAVKVNNRNLPVPVKI